MEAFLGLGARTGYTPPHPAMAQEVQPLPPPPRSAAAAAFNFFAAPAPAPALPAEAGGVATQQQQGVDVTINELPALLRRWLTLQDEIAVLNAEVKQRRTQAKAIREAILRVMEGHAVVQVNVSRGSVIHRTREVKQSLSRKFLLDSAKSFFGGDEGRAAELVNFLEAQRATAVQHDLRLSRGGGSEGGPTA